MSNDPNNCQNCAHQFLAAVCYKVQRYAVGTGKSWTRNHVDHVKESAKKLDPTNYGSNEFLNGKTYNDFYNLISRQGLSEKDCFSKVHNFLSELNNKNHSVAQKGIKDGGAFHQHLVLGIDSILNNFQSFANDEKLKFSDKAKENYQEIRNDLNNLDHKVENFAQRLSKNGCMQCLFKFVGHNKETASQYNELANDEHGNNNRP